MAINYFGESPSIYEGETLFLPNAKKKQAQNL